MGIHLVGGGYLYDVKSDDGSKVGANPPSLAEDGATWTYTWRCDYKSVFPFHDGGNFDGGEDGTNVHGLFGALTVEPPGTNWRNPVTGCGSHGEDGTGSSSSWTGCTSTCCRPGQFQADVPKSTMTMASENAWPQPVEHLDYTDEPFSYRDFVIFFHDEPEFVRAHGAMERDPCDRDRDELRLTMNESKGEVFEECSSTSAQALSPVSRVMGARGTFPSIAQ